MNLRNILWLAPLPSNFKEAWLAPVVLLICVTKVAKSAFDKVLAEHEDIYDVVCSENPLNVIMVWISSSRY
ncbi:hypothetical protein OROMI_021827 [Orobanche minor]